MQYSKWVFDLSREKRHANRLQTCVNGKRFEMLLTVLKYVDGPFRTVCAVNKNEQRDVNIVILLDDEPSCSNHVYSLRHLYFNRLLVVNSCRDTKYRRLPNANVGNDIRYVTYKPKIQCKGSNLWRNQYDFNLNNQNS